MNSVTSQQKKMDQLNELVEFTSPDDRRALFDNSASPAVLTVAASCGEYHAPSAFPLAERDANHLQLFLQQRHHTEKATPLRRSHWVKETPIIFPCSLVSPAAVEFHWLLKTPSLLFCHSFNENLIRYSKWTHKY